jgi:hypothetical protein
MNLPSLSNFVKPHYNEQAGFEGLSTHEIAMAIGAEPHKVFEKITRNRDFLMKSGFRLYGRKVKETGGRDGRDFFVSTDTAKYLVASWKNNMGAAYFRFLMEAEHVATQITPKLIEQLEQAKERISQLEAKNKKRLPGAKEGMIAAPIYQNTLWGVSEIVCYEMRHKETVSEIDQLKAKERHMRKQLKGLMQKFDMVCEKLDGPKVISFPKKK